MQISNRQRIGSYTQIPFHCSPTQCIRSTYIYQFRQVRSGVRCLVGSIADLCSRNRATHNLYVSASTQEGSTSRAGTFYMSRKTLDISTFNCPLTRRSYTYFYSILNHTVTVTIPILNPKRRNHKLCDGWKLSLSTTTYM